MSHKYKSLKWENLRGQVPWKYSYTEYNPEILLCEKAITLLTYFEANHSKSVRRMSGCIASDYFWEYLNNSGLCSKPGYLYLTLQVTYLSPMKYFVFYLASAMLSKHKVTNGYILV